MSMSFHVATRVAGLGPPASMELAQRVRQLRASGVPLIDMSTGDPDFATPPHIIEAAERALREGQTHYGPARGEPDLLEAIAERYAERGVGGIDPGRQVVVTPGGKQAVFETLLAILNPGDEVLIVSPCWLSYADMVRLCGGRPVYVSGDRDRGFRVTEEALEQHVEPRTRAVIVNSPCNPTATVWQRGDLDVIRRVALRHRLIVVSDETYDEIVFDGRRAVSMGAFTDLRDRLFLVNSFSKTYAMTGWRIGYVVGPPDLMDAVLRVQQNTATCTAVHVQRAALAALRGSQEPTRRMVDEYQYRRDLLRTRLADVQRLGCLPIEGTFYALLDVSAVAADSVSASRLFLEQAHVALTPGSAYGPGAEMLLRLSFAVGRQSLKEGLERIVSIAEG